MTEPFTRSELDAIIWVVGAEARRVHSRLDGSWMTVPGRAKADARLAELNRILEKLTAMVDELAEDGAY
ncbi:MAG TPA: hypothetical protein VFE60_14530 [Roseiarcus sp.]|jgi:hypothetical protein|nr:hypothetical protein [Roseiarcus sp.]